MSQLRFRKGHARTLRNVAERLRRDGHGHEVIGMVEDCAAAAAAGQPIAVAPGLADKVADSLERFGAPRPEVAP